VTPAAPEPAILFAEVPDFYAEVERRRGHGLATRAILVGGHPDKRGKVQSASIEARARGVQPGMPMAEALGLCPDAVRLATDMQRYREAQGQLDICLRRIESAIEPVGFGAAYLDVAHRDGTPEAHAERVVATVRAELGWPLRIGIGPTRLIARLAASEIERAGIRRVTADAAAAFLAPLPVTRLPRVGRKAASRLEELGAFTIGDVVALGRAVIERELGSRGRAIMTMAEGRDDAEIRPVRHPRTITREATLRAVAAGDPDAARSLERLALTLERQLVRHGLRAGRLALRVRFEDQTSATRSETLGEPSDDASTLLSRAVALLGRAGAGTKPIRGLGLTVAGLTVAGRADAQLELFRDPGD